MADTAVLNRKRGNIKGQLTKLNNISDDDLKTKADISARITILEKLNCKFEELKVEYYQIVKDDEFSTIEETLTEIDDEFQLLEVRFNTLLINCNENVSSNNNMSSNNNLLNSNNSVRHSSSNTNPRLPEIPLPQFFGKFEDFSVFKTQFQNLISSNDQLTENQKLYYLHAALKGDAKNIQTSDDTYESLFKALQDRYENKRYIVDMHIKSIINYEKITQESPKELRKFLDCINKNLRALKILNYDRDNLSNVMLLNIILQKLDRETRKNYEITLKNNDVPNFDNFLEFLEKQCQVLDSVSRNLSHKSKSVEKNSNSRNFLVKSSNSKISPCICCKNGSHALYKCDIFLNLSPEKRYEFVRKNKLCLNCFSFHKVANCLSKYNCSQCNQRHHSSLHKDESLQLRNQTILPPLSEAHGSNESGCLDSCESNSQSIASCFASNKKKIVLATASVYVLDSNGFYQKARCVLDGGSMIHCISSQFLNALGLKTEKVNIPISGLAGAPISIKRKTCAVIKNEDNSFSTKIECFVVNKITDSLPIKYFDASKLNIPSNIKLGDSSFFKPGKIDLLLGAEIYFDLLLKNKIRASQSAILQETVFGYVLSGAIEGAQEASYCGFLSETDNLENTIKRFWEVENILDAPTSKSKEEIECEKHFINTHRRDENGKYIVKLPIKENAKLGDSLHSCRQSLIRLWKQLDKNPDFSNLYIKFLDEYKQLGHMQEAKDGDLIQPKYVMSHHGVYKPDSSSTKLRVVFNGSEPTTNGVSLNDCLLNGGVVQEDLFAILVRFRTHKIVFTADVKKMYRQIWVDPEQSDWQCILWSNSSKENPKLFKLLTVTYGLKSSAYLATRVLKQLALDEKKNYPLASEVSLRDFYVDDLLTGCEDMPTALNLQQQLISLLKSGGMELHKWCSNIKELLQQVPYDLQEYHFEEGDKNSVKTLGLKWNPKEDSFSFSVSDCFSISTKRTVLAEISRIYDPLGILGPVIVQAKIFLQKLWLLKIEWDQELPSKERKAWEKFRNALPELKHISISRYVFSDSNCKEIQLHGFSDASKDAYGAALYLRTVSSTNDIRVMLLCSKTRVSPLKVLTIPRLELCAAELLSKLAFKVLASLNLQITRVFLYTDSKIVLAWIRSSPHSLKVFVSNRITRIQELTKSFSWHHVKTADNPADLVSRGLNPDQLADRSLWWNGPSFLHQENLDIDSELPPISDESYLLEFKKTPEITLSINVSVTILDTLLCISNSFSKLIRIVSFIFRFLHNVRNVNNRIVGPLTCQELHKGTLFLVRCVQEAEFSQDIYNLRKGNSATGKLKNLNPFLDEFNVLRVGGRIRYCNIDVNQKHPPILPASHKLTYIIIDYFHKKYLHLGPQNLLYSIRRHFWPLRGRTSCRKVVHDCVICFKAKPLTAEQIMGDLPRERVNVDFPFNCTGVDFCGPFLIKYRGQRKGIFHKVYISIFVCMVTKAVHLDLVCDLTSEAFIATLKRFFARRGKSQKLFSDNATNFVGANLELKRLHKLLSKPDEMLSNFLASESIEWRFLPPKSPNFGGLWEAAVKSFKYHFKRVVGSSKLTYEELLTIICQIEGILNSRPLTPLSDDSDDLEVLTPGHFLIGRPITEIPEPNLTNFDTNRLSIWQKTTKIVQLIWKKWQNNYLSTIQERNKWRVQKENIKIGDMVIIKEDNIPACKWVLGRIQDTFYGKDSKVRVVNIKTEKGIFKRPISKVAILPIEK